MLCIWSTDVSFDVGIIGLQILMSAQLKLITATRLLTAQTQKVDLFAIVLKDQLEMEPTALVIGTVHTLCAVKRLMLFEMIMLRFEGGS